jgi:hypothetical protein
MLRAADLVDDTRQPAVGCVGFGKSSCLNSYPQSRGAKMGNV